MTTGIDVYFCDPRSPWQRDPNGKTNGPQRARARIGIANPAYNVRRLLWLNTRPAPA